MARADLLPGQSVPYICIFRKAWLEMHKKGTVSMRLLSRRCLLFPGKGFIWSLPLTILKLMLMYRYSGIYTNPQRDYPIITIPCKSTQVFLCWFGALENVHLCNSLGPLKGGTVCLYFQGFHRCTASFRSPCNRQSIPSCDKHLTSLYSWCVISLPEGTQGTTQY